MQGNWEIRGSRGCRRHIYSEGCLRFGVASSSIRVSLVTCVSEDIGLDCGFPFTRIDGVSDWNNHY